MAITIIILVLSAVFFMSGKVRSDLVALCALVLLILFNILTPEEALSGFSNSVVIMMVGLFVVGKFQDTAADHLCQPRLKDGTAYNKQADHHNNNRIRKS